MLHFGDEGKLEYLLWKNTIVLKFYYSLTYFYLITTPCQIHLSKYLWYDFNNLFINKKTLSWLAAINLKSQVEDRDTYVNNQSKLKANQKKMKPDFLLNLEFWKKKECVRHYGCTCFMWWNRLIQAKENSWFLHIVIQLFMHIAPGNIGDE